MLERLSQDRLAGLLRGERTTAGAQKEGAGVPDVVGELQRDELEQPEGDTAQQDKALAGLPRPLDGGEVLHNCCQGLAER